MPLLLKSASARENPAAIPDFQPGSQNADFPGRCSAPRKTSLGGQASRAMAVFSQPRPALIKYQIFPSEQRIQSIRRVPYTKKPFLNLLSRNVLSGRLPSTGPEGQRKTPFVPKQLQVSLWMRHGCDTVEFGSTYMTNEGQEDRQIRNLIYWESDLFDMRPARSNLGAAEAIGRKCNNLQSLISTWPRLPQSRCNGQSGLR
jgi:hypothetical protein